MPLAESADVLDGRGGVGNAEQELTLLLQFGTPDESRGNLLHKLHDDPTDILRLGADLVWFDIRIAAAAIVVVVGGGIVGEDSASKERELARGRGCRADGFYPIGDRGGRVGREGKAKIGDGLGDVEDKGRVRGIGRGRDLGGAEAVEVLELVGRRLCGLGLDPEVGKDKDVGVGGG